MTTTVKALANMSRRVARYFHRLFSPLFRKAEMTFGLTIAIPPFVKMEIHFKKTLAPANDNRRSRRKCAFPASAGLSGEG